MSEQGTTFRLEPEEGRRIEKRRKKERGVRIYPRYQAWLWPDDGEPVDEVAALLDRDPSTLRLLGAETGHLKAMPFAHTGAGDRVAHQPTVHPLAEVDDRQRQAVVAEGEAETIHRVRVRFGTPTANEAGDRIRSTPRERRGRHPLSRHVAFPLLDLPGRGGCVPGDPLHLC